MSRRGQRQTACEGKIRFEGQRVAEQVAKKMRRRHGELLVAYLCNVCDHYHVGHTKPSKAKGNHYG